MKKLFMLLGMFVPFVLFPARVSAQTRVLVGIEGADAFSNVSLGVVAGIEVPFAKRFELDLKDTFSPIEAHVALGRGRSNIISGVGLVWISKSWGLNGQVEYSSYNVTKASKGADYAFGGFTYRGMIGGAPTRLFFDYIHQFDNGISANGTETSRLQGGDIGFTMRFGCLKAFCVRTSEDFEFGGVKTQGNPQCDGTYGLTGGPNGGPCPRTTAFSGGVTASVAIEFPRHRGHEKDVF